MNIEDFEFEIKPISLGCDSETPTRRSHASIEEKVVQEKAIKRRIKNDQIHMLAARRLDQLCIRPLPGEQWRIITEKAFNAYAFICSLLQNGGVVDDLHLAIYRINEPTVDSIIEMIDDGRIQRATIIISNFFNQTKRPEKWAIKLADFCDGHPRVTFAYLHNHSKVVCAKQCDNYYVFEGSGNMSDNARIEQYTYENNRLVYDFHTEWMDRLICELGQDKKKVEA